MTLLTYCSSKNSPQITVVPPTAAAASAGAASSESMIQIHSDNTNNPNAGGQRVALVTSQSNPNKISIVPADQISKTGCTVTTSSDFTANTVANITKNTNPVSDENSINEANRIITKPPQPQQQG